MLIQRVVCELGFIQRVICELGFLLGLDDMTSAEDTVLVAFLPPQTSSDIPV